VHESDEPTVRYFALIKDGGTAEEATSVAAEGEYEAYLLAVKYGSLHGPCASFSEVIAKGRAEIEHVRSQ